MNYGVQLGRRFRALKLWMVIRGFGTAGLAARLRAHCALAQDFAAWVRADPSWEVVAPVPLSLVCFRYTPSGVHEEALNELNARILARVNESGEAFLSHTRLGGRYILRLAVGNIRTEERHVRRAWELLRQAAL
jgi:aromatic-L-amino-acid/L-tryptophan decarboxylase